MRVLIEGHPFLNAIQAEYERAKEKFPPFNSAHEAYAVILEEVDEFWKEVKWNPRGEKEARHRNMLMAGELQQIAAMCLRAYIDLLEQAEAE